MTMHERARFVAKQMTAAGQPAWLYRFGYVAESLRPKASGAEHSTELPFLFGTLDVRYARYDAANSELMMFTPDGGAIVQADPWKSRLDLIERAVEAQAALSR